MRSTGVRQWRRLSRYPHMAGEDVPIWERYLAERPNWADSVEYDVEVGPAELTGVQETPFAVAVAERLSRRRIDAVASVGDEVWVIEVKPRLSMSALGQVLVYRHWLRNEIGASRRVMALIVFEAPSVSVSPVAISYGVGLWRVSRGTA